MWRAACSFPKYKSDIYRDYVRVRIKELDILTFNAEGACKKVDHINIRGHKASNITVPFWQSASFSFHTDSTKERCKFNAARDSVNSEDNFGFYHKVNPNFRCTESEDSTTQYWFGGHI